MQKKLIALAIAAAFSAPAFAADVTVYGIADAALVSNSTTGSKSYVNVISGGLSTSRLGVNASEDLGNGMKAFANLEYKLDVSTNAGTALATNARQQAAGVSGGFGTVKAGFLQDAAYYWAGKFDPTAGSSVSTVNAVNPSAKTYINMSARISNAIDYTSPNMGGFSFAISHSFNNGSIALPVASGATTGNPTSVTTVNAMYEAGPLAVGVAYASDSNDDTGFAKTTDTALGASYDLGAAKLYATYQTTKADVGTTAFAVANTSTSSNKGMSFSAVAPVGADAVVATVGKEKIDTTAASDDKTGYTLAYLHNMSKMTTLYAAAQKVTNGGGANVDVTLVAVGLRYKF